MPMLWALTLLPSALQAPLALQARLPRRIGVAQPVMRADPPPVERGVVMSTSQSQQNAEDEEYVAITLENMQDDGPATIALSLVVGYILSGVLVYWQAVPDWSLLDAVYFVAVTLSSVGYGDLAPEGDALKLFTAFYILVGVAVLGTALGEVVSSLLEADATPAGRMLKWLSGGGGAKEDDDEKGDGEGAGEQDPLDLLSGGDAKAALIQTVGTVAATIGVGCVAFLQLHDPGMDGGDMTPVDALYMSVVTLTTVGYGDVVPQGDAARGFVAAYALFGTALLARALGAVAALPLERRREYQQRLVLEQYGDELDGNEFEDLQKTITALGLCDVEQGYCTKSDFALAMLVRQDKCTTDDIRMALGTFEKLDADGSGELDRADVELFLEKEKSAAA